MPDELVTQTIDLPSGELCILQPRESAELPDDGAVEWAPLAPYWSVLWRSGVELARELEGEDRRVREAGCGGVSAGEPRAGLLRGRRVVELGCGLAVPAIAAARAGAHVLATDADPEALELAERNAERSGTRIETVLVDWTSPADLIERGPFDLVLAADVLYERATVAVLLDLLPRLAGAAWLADPGRPAAGAFLDGARRRGWKIDTRRRGVVSIHRLGFG